MRGLFLSNTLTSISLPHKRAVLLLASCVLLLTQCAKQVVPAGGPKDVTPPKAVKTSPENFSTNLYPRTVSITFDEFIDLKDPATQVFISPTTSTKPLVKLRNKTIEVTLPDTLQPNTTYSIYFGNAIRDLDEGNVLDNFQYVFSTGSYIDSLQLKGTVFNSLDNKPYANALVMLRTDPSDSAIAKTRPDYFARTDADGLFKIGYLRSARYRVTALDDANSNFRYDPTETVAFYDSLVNVVDTNKTVRLYMFRAEPLQNKLLSAKVSTNSRVAVAFAKGVSDLQAELTEPSQTNLQYTYTLQRDTVTLYLPKINADTVRLRLRDDSMDTLVRLRLPPVSPRDTIKRKGNSSSFDVSTNLFRSKADLILPHAQPLRLFFSMPVSAYDSTRLTLVKTSDSTKALPMRTFVGIDTLTHRYFLQVNFNAQTDTAYRLLLSDSLAHDALRTYSRKQRLDFRSGEAEESGNLIVHVKGMDSSSQHILVLQSTGIGYEQRWVLQGKTADVKANDLVPGAYTLQLIYDQNRNRRRDSGNYWQHRQPEKASSYSGGVAIRANWDMEVTVNADNETTATNSGKGLKGSKEPTGTKKK